jgi:hypothetical protein
MKENSGCYDLPFCRSYQNAQRDDGEGIGNEYGFLGMYQMGEHMLKAVGLYEGDSSKKNDWKGAWTGLRGVESTWAYLSSPEAQEYAIRRANELYWAEIQNRGLDSYIGGEVRGVTVTASGLLAAVHHDGGRKTAEFIRSGGGFNPGDANGATPLDYLREFGGYGVPFRSRNARAR